MMQRKLKRNQSFGQLGNVSQRIVLLKRNVMITF